MNIPRFKETKQKNFHSDPGGVLDISLGGEVQRGPSYLDPV